MTTPEEVQQFIDSLAKNPEVELEWVEAQIATFERDLYHIVARRRMCLGTGAKAEAERTDHILMDLKEKLDFLKADRNALLGAKLP